MIHTWSQKSGGFQGLTFWRTSFGGVGQTCGRVPRRRSEIIFAGIEKSHEVALVVDPSAKDDLGR